MPKHQGVPPILSSNPTQSTKEKNKKLPVDRDQRTQEARNEGTKENRATKLSLTINLKPLSS
jgi:hypothetical protein